MVVIALGASLLLPALTRPASLLAHLQRRSEALWVAGNVLSEAESHLRKYGRLESWSPPREVDYSGRSFEVGVRLEDPGYGPRVTSMTVEVAWNDGRDNKLSRHEILAR